MFVPPTWLEGFLVQFVLYIIIPLIIATTVGIIVGKKIGEEGSIAGLMTFGLVFLLGILVMAPIVSVYWHDTYEKPSIQEKVITVSEWQPKPGVGVDDNGFMKIDNADELMLITTEQEGFLNEENFFFNKFNTRDILNQLRVNGTYKIKYYGWRNGFNSGFPNILSVEEVVNENGTVPMKYSDYFGTKLTA